MSELIARLKESGSNKRTALAVAIALALVALWFSNSSVENTSQQPTKPVSITLGTIRVHVVGEVVNPGLYELDGGAIAADAVSMAGGMTPEAVEASVNLARVLSDGEQLRVLAQDAYQEAASGLISLNSATSAQLEELSGIGPATAKRILDYRQANGPFASIEELMQVSGIGPSLFGKIKDQITL